MVGRKNKEAWVVAVDMGYGHLRAAHALLRMAKGGAVLSADSYPDVPAADRAVWKSTRRLYGLISRLKGLPLFGDLIFSLFDSFQGIPSFYPKAKRISSTFQLRRIYGFFERQQWGKHLISQLQGSVPLVATFFVPAFMAERWKYEGPVFLVATDSDISRAWAPLRPLRTQITYLAPTERAVERLLSYGVPKSRVLLTGFPLPDIFSVDDLQRRVELLDGEGRYEAAFAPLLQKHLGKFRARTRAVSVTFAVGGAGAQSELGKVLVEAFAPDMRKGKMRLNLVAATHESSHLAFKEAVQKAGCQKTVNILYEKNKERYFVRFNALMKKTDVLWTKPSELVFFSALGIPLILAPPIGSQEKANRRWVMEKGFGVDQPDLKVVREWFWDVVAKGLLAEAAMEGYLEGEREGVKKISRAVFGK